MMMRGVERRPRMVLAYDLGIRVLDDAQFVGKLHKLRADPCYRLWKEHGNDDGRGEEGVK